MIEKWIYIQDFHDQSVKEKFKEKFDNLLSFKYGSKEFEDFVELTNELDCRELMDVDCVEFSNDASDVGLYEFSLQEMDCVESGCVDGVRSLSELVINADKVKNKDIFAVKRFSENGCVVSERLKNMLDGGFSGVKFTEIKACGVLSKRYFWLDSANKVEVDSSRDLIEDELDFYTKKFAKCKSYFAEGKVDFSVDVYFGYKDIFSRHGLVFSNRLMRFLKDKKNKVTGFATIKIYMNGGMLKLPHLMLPIWDDEAIETERQNLKRRIAVARARRGDDWATEPFVPPSPKKKNIFGV